MVDENNEDIKNLYNIPAGDNNTSNNTHSVETEVTSGEVAECPVCGAIIPATASTCPKCGAVFEDEEETGGQELDQDRESEDLEEEVEDDALGEEQLPQSLDTNSYINPKKYEIIKYKLRSFLFGKIRHSREDIDELVNILGGGPDYNPNSHIEEIYVPKKLANKIRRRAKDKELRSFKITPSGYVILKLRPGFDKEKLRDYAREVGAKVLIDRAGDNHYLLIGVEEPSNTKYGALALLGLLGVNVVANLINGTADFSSFNGTLDTILNYKETVTQHVSGSVSGNVNISNGNMPVDGNITYRNGSRPFSGNVTVSPDNPLNGDLENGTLEGIVSGIKRTPTYFAALIGGLVAYLHYTKDKNTKPINNVIRAIREIDNKIY